MATRRWVAKMSGTLLCLEKIHPKNVRKNWDLDGFGDLFFESPAILGVQGFDRFDQQMDRFDQQMGNAYYFDQFQGF